MKVTRIEGEARVELNENLTFVNADKIREQVLSHIDPDLKVLVLNIEEVDFMDSAGIGILISILKKMQGNNGRLIVEHPKLGVQKLFEMTKLDQIMEVRKRAETTTGSWDDFED